MTLSLRSNRSARCALAAAVLLALEMVACGGSSFTPPPPAVSVTLAPSASRTLDAGQTLAVTASVANDGTGKGVSWSMTGGGTLSQETTAAATYTAPANLTAATAATITATSVASTTAAASLAVTVNPDPAVATASLPAATVNTAYSATLRATGGTGALTWSVSAGALPGWASLNAATGVVSGTPTTPGTVPFSVIATDSLGVASAPQALSLAASAAPLAVATTSLPNATAGAAYSATLQATGGTAPYTWSVSAGALPGWASLNASSGVVSGTPLAAGSASFTVQAEDSTSATATQALTLAVNAPAPLAVTTAALPAGRIGAAYSTTLQATGGVGPYIWSVRSGILPTWASLSASGIITGTPTASGSASFGVQVQDSQSTPATATQALTLAVPTTNSNDAELKGQYAFLLEDANAQASLEGSITVDGSGHVTVGEYDLQSNAAREAGVAIVSGSYAVGSDNRGTLTFQDGAGHGFAFTIAVGSLSGGIAGRGGIAEDDGQFMFTGTLARQDASQFSAAALNGGYAFGLSGDGGQWVQAGSFSAAAGAITAGMTDSNDAGTVVSGAAFTGSITSIDANGRGTAILTMTASGTATTYAVYVVSGAKLYAAVSSAAAGPAVSGEAVQQTGGPYSPASLNGAVVLTTQGSTNVPSPQAAIALLSFDGSGGATGVTDASGGGSVASNQSITGVSYAITAAANGRFTLSAAGIIPLVGYLAGPNTAFLVDGGPSPTISRALPQAAGPFTEATLHATYFIATEPIFAAPVPPPAGIAPLTNETGVVNFDGVSAFSSTVDAVQPGGASSGLAVAESYTVAGNGRVASGSGDIVIYIVSPAHLIVLQTEPNNPNPTLQDLWQ
jgi:hypothetical protein